RREGQKLEERIEDLRRLRDDIAGNWGIGEWIVADLTGDWIALGVEAAAHRAADRDLVSVGTAERRVSHRRAPRDSGRIDRGVGDDLEGERLAGEHRDLERDWNGGVERSVERLAGDEDRVLIIDVALDDLQGHLVCRRQLADRALDGDGSGRRRHPRDRGPPGEAEVVALRE